MSDTLPITAEAFPEKLHIFRRDRKMTYGDHVDHDPNDWQAYIRADFAQAQIDAAAIREEALYEAISHARQTLVDTAHTYGGAKGSAMFTA
jgi:hypothetical protein